MILLFSLVIFIAAYCNWKMLELILDTSTQLMKISVDHGEKIRGLKLRLFGLFALALLFFGVTVAALMLNWLIYQYDLVKV